MCGRSACRGWSPPPWWWRWLHRNRFLTAENRRLRAEILRLSGSEHTLRNVIALNPYNCHCDPGTSA